MSISIYSLSYFHFVLSFQELAGDDAHDKNVGLCVNYELKIGIRGTTNA
jgi:hypothetical protein